MPIGLKITGHRVSVVQGREKDNNDCLSLNYVRSMLNIFKPAFGILDILLSNMKIKKLFSKMENRHLTPLVIKR